MQRLLGTIIGKLLQSLLRLGRTGGQALPGLVIERLCPHYLIQMAAQLPEGVVLVTGTNGKTTTTKMIVELLQAAGQKVITNPTGSNLTRGLAASFAEHATWTGGLKQDIAVFEVDEAFAVQFVKLVKPRWVLALNVSRDQLDRFGEVDAVANLLASVMQAATVGVVTNANDPRLNRLPDELAVKHSYFGVAADLRHFFPTDNELVSVEEKDATEISAPRPSKPDVELVQFADKSATYLIDGKKYRTRLQVTGQHNFQNAAAALALVQNLLPEREIQQLVDDLANVSIAFGRGEVYDLPTGKVQLVLVKNPPSFRQALASYPIGNRTAMVVINDNYADSRDVSWLWDVDFTVLKQDDIALTSGSRAADMALRLQYAEVEVGKVEPDIQQALAALYRQTGDKLILATYTAMLGLHDSLTRMQTEKQRG